MEIEDRRKSTEGLELIRLEGLCKSYGTGNLLLPVLKNITTEINRGEYVALMGSSGSGKTTLMNLIGCLDRPTSGKYLLDGENVNQLSSDQRANLRNKRIGFIFQSFNLLRRTSALENVLMPRTYATDHQDEGSIKKRAIELLKRVGLASRMDHEPSQLSGGQQQRVAIARALINSPSILLADEPTGNLDSQTSSEVLDLMEELNQQEGVTIVLVTHEQAVSERAQRVLRLRDGVIYADEKEIDIHC